jgi:hypothetical protein
MRGMVNVPVVTTLAAALPFIIPKSPLANIETFAGPPGLPPAKAIAKSVKNLLIPVSARKEPKRMKRII